MRATGGYEGLTVGISRDWHDWRWLGGGVPGVFGRLCGIFEKLWKGYKTVERSWVQRTPLALPWSGAVAQGYSG